MPLSLKNER